jgi:N-acetylglutamate synthase-like GNAT family acetyltransferase
MTNFWVEHWGGDVVISRRRTHYVNEVDGFIAEIAGEKIGLITYKRIGNEIEITSMNSLVENKGIGTSLVNEVVKMAQAYSIKRVVLVTTNDNMKALKFWQKRGFHLVRVNMGAIEYSRKLKPSIPLTGNDGIPIRDEIELELVF